MAKVMCYHSILRSEPQGVLCIKYAGAIVTFVKISSPEISVGMGLNLSHERTSRAFHFQPRQAQGKMHFFLLMQTVKAKQSSLLNTRQILPHGTNGPYETCTLHARLRERGSTAPEAISMARVFPTGLPSLSSLTYQGQCVRDSILLIPLCF